MEKDILIVDDDPVVRMLIEQMLSAAGHTVTVAENGQECLDTLETHKPDVILLDLMMPDMSGIDVLKQIRSAEATRNIPVIMLSASMANDRLTESEDVQPEGFIEKPFKANTLLEAIAKVSPD